MGKTIRAAILSRWGTAKRLYARKWGIIVVVGILLAALDFWRDEGPEKLQPPRILADVTSWLPWYGWIIFALALALCLTFEAAHRELTRSSQGSNREIRNKLAAYALSGQSLINHIHESMRAKDDQPPWDELNEWDGEVIDYLQANLGDDYAVRFGSHAGLPTGTTTLWPPFSGAESQIKTRVARLNEFMKELATSGK